jgi:hypothetical protein
MNHYLTKMNFFNTIIKDVIIWENLLSFDPVFVSFDEEVYAFLSNIDNKRETFIKDPITVKFKCNGKFFDKNGCVFGTCIESNYCLCDEGDLKNNFKI